MGYNLHMEKKKKKSASKPNGRPSIYTPELGQAICARLAGGESLRAICRDEAMPRASTVFYWLLDKTRPEFLEHYKTARDIQADLMADELLDIADNSANDYMERELGNGATIDVVNTENIQRSRLRIDARKWAMSKIKPKKYGDKIDVTSDGKQLPQPIINVHRDNGNAQD
jgi:hypothetical protein